MSVTTYGARGPTRIRLELAHQVASFRTDGMTYPEIAEELGISRAYAWDLFYDPDGSKSRARKESYAGTCLRCGRPTSGSGGREKAPDYCRLCATTVYAEQKRYWTRERIVQAIQQWAREHEGRPPSARSWRKSHPSGKHPASSAVYKRVRDGGLQPFRSWAEAIEAAGFPRPKSGKRPNEFSWSSEEVLRQLREKSPDGVLAPSSVQYLTLQRACRHYFGTWTRACEAAGLVARRPRATHWGEKQVIDEIQAYAIGDLPPPLGEVPRSVADKAYGLFGSWDNAVRAAGYKPLGSGPSRRSKERKRLLAEFGKARVA